MSRASLHALITGAILSAPLSAWAQNTTVAAQETTVAGGDLMLLSYIALWLLIFAFVFTIFRAQRALQSDLEQLQRRIDGLHALDHHEQD